jgi:hypothetical protein
MLFVFSILIPLVRYHKLLGLQGVTFTSRSRHNGNIGFTNSANATYTIIPSFHIAQ